MKYKHCKCVKDEMFQYVLKVIKGVRNSDKHLGSVLSNKICAELSKHITGQLIGKDVVEMRNKITERFKGENILELEISRLSTIIENKNKQIHNLLSKINEEN